MERVYDECTWLYDDSLNAYDEFKFIFVFLLSSRRSFVYFMCNKRYTRTHRAVSLQVYSYSYIIFIYSVIKMCVHIL